MANKIYFIGIGGAGTSMLARIYKNIGYDVLGSDEGDGFYTEGLKKEGIRVFDKFNKDNLNVKNIEFVVYSTAYDESNIEMRECRKKGIRLISYPEAVGKLTKKYKTIAVCGTHGKTTTTAMTSFGLEGSGILSTTLVGSVVNGWNGGVKIGDSEYFVLEADEYQNKLGFYSPFIVVLTSMDYDHPDFFNNFEEYKNAFNDFVQKIPKDGMLVACIDDKNVRNFLNDLDLNAVTYGFSKDADVLILKNYYRNSYNVIEFLFEGKAYKLEIVAPGKHNAQNAVAAWIVGNIVSGNNQSNKVSEGIKKFYGIKRRFERIGSYKGAMLFDDYAHHPKEIEATIKASRDVFPDKELIIAFHPHTFSRTEALFDEFTDVLGLADKVLLLDIYGSARESVGNITALDIVNTINSKYSDKSVYVKDFSGLKKWLEDNLDLNKVFFSMGAGDIWKIHNLLIDK